jgi:hypothetical protein
MELVVHITMPDQKHSGLAFIFEEFKMVGITNFIHFRICGIQVE